MDTYRKVREEDTTLQPTTLSDVIESGGKIMQNIMLNHW